jgi:hypothetical protein
LLELIFVIAFSSYIIFSHPLLTIARYCSSDKEIESERESCRHVTQSVKVLRLQDYFLDTRRRKKGKGKKEEKSGIAQQQKSISFTVIVRRNGSDQNIETTTGLHSKNFTFIS